MPIDAQTAGEELSRIYQNEGELNTKKIVDESRPVTAPLHPCFEWDDTIAAEKYREHQAGGIIRSITVSNIGTMEAPQNQRAFVHVQSSYHPLEVVIRDKDKATELLDCAFRELKAFREKYNALSALVPVFEAIERAANEHDQD